MKTLAVELSDRAWLGLQNYGAKYQTDTATMFELLGELLGSPDLSEDEAWAVWRSYLDRNAGHYTNYIDKQSIA